MFHEKVKENSVIQIFKHGANLF